MREEEVRGVGGVFSDDEIDSRGDRMRQGRETYEIVFFIHSCSSVKCDEVWEGKTWRMSWPLSRSQGEQFFLLSLARDKRRRQNYGSDDYNKSRIPERVSFLFFRCSNFPTLDFTIRRILHFFPTDRFQRLTRRRTHRK